MKTIHLYLLILSTIVVWQSCNSVKPLKSIENLKLAYNHESTVSIKYSKFAQAALTEGYDTIAQLFDAASKSENIHAYNHKMALNKLGVIIDMPEIGQFEVKTTAENLQIAINGETYEIQSFYPSFIKIAEAEKAPDAGKAFTWALETEKKHLKYFRQVASALTVNNESTLPFKWYICPLCGNTYNTTDLKEICDLCLTQQENFIGYEQEELQ